MKNVEDNKLLDQKITAWQAVLEEVKLENVRLKNLFASAISKNVSRKFVEQAEIFQQKFLDKDQVFDLLHHDISSLQTDKKELCQKADCRSNRRTTISYGYKLIQVILKLLFINTWQSELPHA